MSPVRSAAELKGQSVQMVGEKPSFRLYTVETSKSYQALTWTPKYVTTMVAIDPGDVHVGVASFGKSREGKWECAWAGEMTPEEFLDIWFAEGMLAGAFDIVVYEKWQLFEDKMASLIGSEMDAAQMIGAIKFIWRSTKHKRWPAGEVELIKQSPSIKKPTTSVLKNRRLQSMAKYLGIPGDHALDAELHGYHHILKTLDEPVELITLARLKKGQ